ncbi:SDR family NAD(P)-dependent oxidoreductase [Prescottella equi]|uniref:SDR family NAD(P)-dependent oxidoreductase n=1 Tax=Rhodococcus hoagii TaxID=43767 RepID=UPI001585B965|nr:SDR family NAD(P)-dependent oxidoreductase [Prescottella equi]
MAAEKGRSSGSLGRSGLVTGGANGIGRAMAESLAREGANVLVSDIDDEAGVETVQRIRSAGGTAEYLHTDVTDEDAVFAMVQAAVEAFGSLDFAMNNAGGGSAGRPLHRDTKENFEHTIRLDYMSVFYCLKAEIIQMRKQNAGGAIVNTASTAGLSGLAGLAAYGGAKWGVIGLTQSAAVENGRFGIRVNALCPGSTETEAIRGIAEMDPAGYQARTSAIPLGRAGRPEEQADAAVWLVSPRSSYVTGVALPVDGGSIIRR